MKVVTSLQYGLPWVTTEFAFILSSKLTTYKIKRNFVLYFVFPTWRKNVTILLQKKGKKTVTKHKLYFK